MGSVYHVKFWSFREQLFVCESLVLPCLKDILRNFMESRSWLSADRDVSFAPRTVSPTEILWLTDLIFCQQSRDYL